MNDLGAILGLCGRRRAFRKPCIDSPSASVACKGNTIAPEGKGCMVRSPGFVLAGSGDFRFHLNMSYGLYCGGVSMSTSF